MKKSSLCLVIVMLSVFMVAVFLFAGCKANAAAPLTSNEEFDVWADNIRKNLGRTEIRIAAATHPSINAFKKMLPQFEKMTGIKVVLDEMQEDLLMQKILLNTTSGKSSYDVVMSCPEHLPKFVTLGTFSPLDNWLADKQKSPSWFDPEDILQAYRDMLSFDGNIYGIPFAGETIFMMYRKDIFEKYGLDVPTTFDELLKTAKFIQENVPDMAGNSMRTRVGWEATYQWSEFIFPFGGKIIDFDTNKPAFDQQGTIDSLKYFVELAKTGPAGIESYCFSDAWDALMQGKAGISVECSAAAPEVENPDKSVVVGKVGYKKMPAGPAGAFSGVWGWGFCMIDASKKKDAAWAFITYMTGKHMQAEYIANGGIISRVSWLENPEKQKEFSYYRPLLDTLKQAADLTAKGYGVVIPDERWEKLSQMMGVEVSRAVAGEITAEEACANMQKQAVDIWK